MNRPAARFIAGAVCPRCGASDRIRVREADGQSHRDCVACGFADVLETPGDQALPQGRLDGPARAPLPDGTRPVRIQPLSPKRSKRP